MERKRKREGGTAGPEVEVQAKDVGPVPFPRLVEVSFELAASFFRAFQMRFPLFGEGEPSVPPAPSEKATPRKRL